MNRRSILAAYKKKSSHFQTGVTGFKSGNLFTYDTKVVDTNASGDTFTAVMLAGLAEYSYDIDSISNDIMYHIMERANAGGAVCAAKRGAIYAVPSVEEIDNCMKTVPLLKLD